MKIFIGGSISINRLNPQITARLDSIMTKGYDVLVGDAIGGDTLIQEYLHSLKYRNVTVYASGRGCRNNVGQWKMKLMAVSPNTLKGDFYKVKDIEMAKDCDYGYFIWNTKSLGTISNIINLVALEKKSLVWVTKLNRFETIKTLRDIEVLITHCPKQAKKLIKKIIDTKFKEQIQTKLF